MKKFSNKYIIIFTVILVAVVAVVLTVVAVGLRPRQLRNQEIEKKQLLLRAVGVEASTAQAEAIYAECITDTATEEGLPYYLFRVVREGNNLSYGTIIPFNGNGLWGPIWGYIAFDPDYTVVGAVFDHQGETPGLGGEIASEKFASRFVGKSILEGGSPTPIVLKKHADPKALHEVDAISGGTMTSNGVTQMLADGIEAYRDLIATE